MNTHAPNEHTHTDECWEPDSGCDMGRNESFAVPCPPTLDAQRAHYQRCIGAAVLEEHKQEFRDELAKLESN